MGMNWMESLYEVYENCKNTAAAKRDENILLPVSHMFKNAQIEVTLDGKGNFQGANVVSGEEKETIIPCTEASGSRSGKNPTSHPLCDKLQYLAGDFEKYGGEMTSGFRSGKSEHPRDTYMKLLESWCASQYAHDKVKVVLEYVKKGCLIKDLVEKKVLVVGEDGKLFETIGEWEKDRKSKGEDASDKPAIFTQLKKQKQCDAFVRWIVRVDGDPRDKLWLDDSVWERWTQFYESTIQSTGLCYVTGIEGKISSKHPGGIRNTGDGAKLISSGETNGKVDDGCGFTFSGRFTEAGHVNLIGYDVSQKALKALPWLLKRQGYRNDTQAIVAYATSGDDTPDIMESFLDLFKGKEGWKDEIRLEANTAQEAAQNLSKLIAGYGAYLKNIKKVCVMGLDSTAGLKGRLSITYYRQLTGSELLERIMHWHESCAWPQDYGKDKETKEQICFVGAPSPKDIAWAAFGRRVSGEHQVDKKISKATVERILPCIVDGYVIPLDIIKSAVSHVVMRDSFEEWEWEKALGITCSIYRQHYYNERRYEMELEKERCTRDYLYGRLLAAADCLEGFALSSYDSSKKRPTTAARMMQRFASNPCSTWLNIELALAPYKAQLGYKAKKYLDVMDEVAELFRRDDYVSNKPLTGEFLLGYHRQRYELMAKKPLDVGKIDDEARDEKENNEKENDTL